MKKSLSIILCLLSSVTFCFSQIKVEPINEYLELEHSCKTSITHRSFKSFYLNKSGKLYVLDKIEKDDKKNENLIFVVYSQNSIDTTVFSLFTVMDHISNSSVVIDSLNGVFENYKEIKAFTYNDTSINSNHYYFIQSNFNNRKTINNIYYGMKCNLNGEAYAKKTNTEVICYDFNTKRWKELLLPDPPAVEMACFQPRNLIDTDGKYYYIAEPLKYKINIYNSQGDSTENISYKDSLFSQKLFDTTTWDVFKNTMLEYNHPLAIVQKFEHLINNNFSLWKIDVVSDSVMLILWSNGRQNSLLQFYVDVWKKKMGKWEIKRRFDLYDKEINTDQILTKYNFTTIHNMYYIQNNKFIILSSLPPDPTKYFNTGMTVGEFNKLTENHLKKNDVTYDILIYDMSKLLE